MATLRIRKYIVTQNMADELNAKMMLMHMLSFSLYIVSGVIFYIAEIHYYTVSIHTLA